MVRITRKTLSNNKDTLFNALAKKGGPGIILLCIIFSAVWAPVSVIGFQLFSYLKTTGSLLPAIGSGPFIVVMVVIGFGIGYIYIAYRLTSKIISTMIPTIREEAKALAMMAETLGAHITTPTGRSETIAVDQHGATTRTKQIMGALLERSKQVLGVQNVRSNIFTLHKDGNLRILDGFHINMEGPMVGADELTISIPNGHLSSGRAYKYFRPILSIKGSDGKWPYASDTCIGGLLEEVRKAHPELKWIISMPIPYQVRPFRLVSGVLNIDGLGEAPNIVQMRALLADLSAAAALIAVLDRSTGFLKGKYSVPEEPSNTEQEQLKGHLISPVDFDPASCPEPSDEFVQSLSHIAGLEFFSRISAADVASFLREQLRS